MLNYIQASSMYGTTHVREIVPEIPRTGARFIDIWPRVHGEQREQMDAMGHDQFRALLDEHGVGLGMLTRYDLGPFGLQDEMKVAREFGASIIITGSGGPKGLAGEELKEAVSAFAEKVKPHVAAAEEAGIIIGIENHGNALVDSADSIRWLIEAVPSEHLGIALAPYHLPQDEALIAGLICDLGPRLAHFYAWQHGNGCMEKLPKEQELLQLPSRGPLDFIPIMRALQDIHYQRWTSVFMHPTPRGIPILETTAAVTDLIIEEQEYLESCLDA